MTPGSVRRRRGGRWRGRGRGNSRLRGSWRRPRGRRRGRGRRIGRLRRKRPLGRAGGIHGFGHGRIAGDDRRRPGDRLDGARRTARRRIGGRCRAVRRTVRTVRIGRGGRRISGLGVAGCAISRRRIARRGRWGGARAGRRRRRGLVVGRGLLGRHVVRVQKIVDRAASGQCDRAQADPRERQPPRQSVKTADHLAHQETTAGEKNATQAACPGRRRPATESGRSGERPVRQRGRRHYARERPPFTARIGYWDARYVVRASMSAGVRCAAFLCIVGFSLVGI